MEETIQSLIKAYDLQPHPEGGYYKEKYRSDQTVFSKEAQKERQAISHIYYLLTKGQVARFHKVLHDEIWHVYQGAPMKLIYLDGTEMKEEIFGPGCKEYFAVINSLSARKEFLRFGAHISFSLNFYSETQGSSMQNPDKSDKDFPFTRIKRFFW